MNTNEETSRAPSFGYLTTSFILLAIMQVYNLIMTSTLMITIVMHRPFRTIPNLLIANSSFAIFYYSTLFLVQLAIGWKPQSIPKTDACVILSYLTVIGANGICYSYLVTATSQYFFNILYRQKYLLTFRIHWLIIVISWKISCLLPLFLYLPGLLQYSVETNFCGMTTNIQWIVIVYMFMAVGVPLSTISVIYFYIVRHSRRIQVKVIAFNNPISIKKRDLRVLRHMMTLVAILGTAGLPAMIVMIWNLVSSQSVPVFLYLLSILTISFCTNVQITFIFAMNKRVKDFLRMKLRHFLCRF